MKLKNLICYCTPSARGSMRKRHSILCLITLVLVPSLAFSWSATGHQAVAQIAYERLNPVAREEVDRLIHVFADFEPQVDHFVPAASWMDMSRGYDIGMWDNLHFVSLPYNPDMLDSVRGPAEQNVVWAINHAKNTLMSKNSGDFQKALMLRMIIHFVGDVHQPLHATERYSRENPTGELGGNLFRVELSEADWKRFREMNPGNPNRFLMKQPNTLHGIWDEIGLLYPFIDPQDPEEWSKRIPLVAKEISERFPAATLPNVGESDPMVWARESNQTAIDFVYQGVEYDGKVTAAYFETTQEQATKRVALAGYRLAAMLNSIFPE